MRQKSLLLELAILIVGLSAQPALAQKFEVHPYGGGIFPGDWRDSFDLKRQGVYGITGGF